MIQYQRAYQAAAKFIATVIRTAGHFSEHIKDHDEFHYRHPDVARHRIVRSRSDSEANASQANWRWANWKQQLSFGVSLSRFPAKIPSPRCRCMSLQRLLQRKDQVKTNLETTQSYSRRDRYGARRTFSICWSTPAARPLSVVGTTITDTQRQTAAQQINQTIQQLLNMGNQQFRGRYLFSGSESLDAPFQENCVGNDRISGQRPTPR